jgi:Uma2 family endonuclease
MAIAEREIVSQAPHRLYTEDEYLALEEMAEEKSEYIHGEICAMSGGTDAHATIPMSLDAELRAVLRGRGCRVMSSDIKVYAAGEIYYPDPTVVCGLSQYPEPIP